MLWLPLLTSALQPLPLVLAEGASGPEPLTLTTVIVGYGPIGVVAIVMAWALYRGTFTRSADVAAIVDRGRADLKDELDRIIADKNAEISRLLAERDKAQGQYEATIRLIQDQVFPMLTEFTSATNSLLPVLQRVVSNQRESDERDPGGRRR